MKREVVIISGRTARAIYSPTMASVLGALGETQYARASHVEPGTELSQEALDTLLERGVARQDKQLQLFVAATNEPVNSKWWADMLPSGGPVLGPFDDNQGALAAEAAWLREHNIPNCRNGECRIQIEPPAGPVLSQADLDASSDLS